MGTIIDGKIIARAIIKKLRAHIKNANATPGLAVILIGEDEASKIYVHEKCKQARALGVAFHLFTFPRDVSHNAVLQCIQTLNTDASVHGIIVQFPIPRSLDADALIASLDPHKDADGFHPKNIERFLHLPSLNSLLEQPIIIPVTPSAIIEIIRHVNHGYGKMDAPEKIVLVGKCSVFVTPLIRYFELQKRARFEVVSPQNAHLHEKTRAADILIAATGRPRLITAPMVKERAIVIDVGTSRVEGKIVGDVDFERVKEKASFITPQTGGVGPVTVAILMRNVVFAATSHV